MGRILPCNLSQFRASEQNHPEPIWTREINPPQQAHRELWAGCAEASPVLRPR
jgi:hypothetical protein